MNQRLGSRGESKDRDSLEIITPAKLYRAEKCKVKKLLIRKRDSRLENFLFRIIKRIGSFYVVERRKKSICLPLLLKVKRAKSNKRPSLKS